MSLRRQKKPPAITGIEQPRRIQLIIVIHHLGSETFFVLIPHLKPRPRQLFAGRSAGEREPDERADNQRSGHTGACPEYADRQQQRTAKQHRERQQELRYCEKRRPFTEIAAGDGSRILHEQPKLESAGGCAYD